MITYPSIPKSGGMSFRVFDAHVFDKIDGSNLRFEWSRKQGWHKYGTRIRLFDETDPIFGQAIPVFHTCLADPLVRIARSKRWDRMVCFAEYWGKNSFAGWHDPTEPKNLTLFDVCVQQEFLDPREFVKLFGSMDHVVAYLGKVNWTRGFVQKVREGLVEGITFEGVVGKSGSGAKTIRAKAKTQSWIDKVCLLHSEEDALKIIES